MGGECIIYRDTFKAASMFPANAKEQTYGSGIDSPRWIHPLRATCREPWHIRQEGARTIYAISMKQRSLHFLNIPRSS